jgi:hypothetical protein
MIQQQINEIQASHHVGTRGILSRGRRRSEDSALEAFLNIDSVVKAAAGGGGEGEGGGGEEIGLHHSPRRGKLCSNEFEESDTGHKCENNNVSSVKSFAPVLLRPSSPIVKQKSSIGLEDAKSSMNIDVNFDGYANNKASALYSNRGASLETANDKNILCAFACGGELEKKFGSKEERVKSLPRVFLKRMVSFAQQYCSYKVPTAKLSTSRAVMALEVGVECSYTLEISLAGDSKKLFQPTDLLNIGKAMGKSLHDWMQPALAYVETKRILEEQERVRQEQLDAYFNYNSKNKDRESRMGSGSRPQSGSTSRPRLVPSVGVKAVPLNVNDLDTFVNINTAAAAKKSGSGKPPSLSLEGHKVTEAVERVYERNKQKIAAAAADRPPLRGGSSKSMLVKEGDKVGYAREKRRKESPPVKVGTTTSYDHHDQVLTPSLHVRHPVPEYIIDGSEKGDLLSNSVHVDAPQNTPHTKPSSTVS